MKTRIKEIKVYVSKDGSEYYTEKECRENDNFIDIKKLHKKLLECNFYKRYKIVPYFHNYDVTCIEPRSELKEYLYDTYDKKGNTRESCAPSYVLVYGRMGNGNDYVRLKKRGNKIILLKWSDDSDIRDVDYLGTIPSKWIDMDLEELQKEVDTFISKRKIFVKEIKTTQKITYREI